MSRRSMSAKELAELRSRKKKRKLRRVKKMTSPGVFQGVEKDLVTKELGLRQIARNIKQVVPKEDDATARVMNELRGMFSGIGKMEEVFRQSIIDMGDALSKKYPVLVLDSMDLGDIGTPIEDAWKRYAQDPAKPIK